MRRYIRGSWRGAVGTERWETGENYQGEENTQEDYVGPCGKAQKKGCFHPGAAGPPERSEGVLALRHDGVGTTGSEKVGHPAAGKLY